MSTKIELLICNKFKDRLLGLMFQKNIKCALCFPKCNSIHTFFMKEPIQVIITNKQNIVLYENIIKPWRILLPIKNGYYTYEYPITHIQNIKLNDKFKELSEN